MLKGYGDKLGYLPKLQYEKFNKNKYLSDNYHNSRKKLHLVSAITFTTLIDI